MPKYAEKVFINGVIYTIDSAESIKEAIAVKDNRILCVGTNAQISEYIDSKAQVIDLENKIVFPGFIEGHLHAPGAAYNELFNVNLYGAQSSQETLELVKKFVHENPEKNIYYGRGFNPGFFKDEEMSRGPRKERLDAICSEKAIILTDFGGHVLWMNSKAFEIYSIDETTESPVGGVIEIDPETGKLWGTLKEYAKQLVPYQSFTDGEAAQAAQWFQNTMHKYGYTSIFALRPGGTIIPRETIFHSFQLLEQKGELKLRVNGARDIDPNGPIIEQFEELIELKNRYESELIKVNTAKYFADGVIEGVTGCLLEPYEREADKGDDFYGEFIWEKEKLSQSFYTAMKHNFQIHVHSIGDGATRYTIDAMEYALKRLKKQPDQYRNVLTHLQLVKSYDITRMARLGIIANVQAYWHYKSPSMWAQLERPLIGVRAETEYPLKSLLDAGVMITASSDHPVTPVPNPFCAIQAAVTRNLVNAEDYGLEKISSMDDPKWLLNKAERVRVLDMIKAYTINGAYQLFRETEIGSIEEGKYADFIVVDQDPFMVDPLELEDIKILETFFNGETVYKRDSHDK